jgi:hypothetical protein
MILLRRSSPWAPSRSKRSWFYRMISLAGGFQTHRILVMLRQGRLLHLLPHLDPWSSSLGLNNFYTVCDFTAVVFRHCCFFATSSCSESIESSRNGGLEPSHQFSLVWTTSRFELSFPPLAVLQKSPAGYCKCKCLPASSRIDISGTTSRLPLIARWQKVEPRKKSPQTLWVYLCEKGKRRIEIS